jgi:hypothetical protein
MTRRREREGCDSVLLWLVSMEMEEEKEKEEEKEMDEEMEMTKVDEIQKEEKTRA